MKKNNVIWIIIILALIFSGCSNFSLRKPEKIGVPIENSQYLQKKYYIYHVDYGTTLDAHETFYEEFFAAVKGSAREEKQYILAISTSGYNALLSMAEGKLPKDEALFEKPASTLTGEEKATLNQRSFYEMQKKLVTIQDYLNAQIYWILKFYGKTSEFKKGSFYTEAQKDQLIHRLIAYRYYYLAELKRAHIMIMEIKSLENKHKASSDKYYYSPVLPLTKNSTTNTLFFDHVAHNHKPVLITNLSHTVINQLYYGEQQIKSPITFIVNDQYHGYIYNEKAFVFFIGGKKGFYEYPEYKIDVEEKSVQMSKLLEKESSGALFKALKINLNNF